MRSVTASQLAQPRAAATTGVVRARDDSCRRALWHVCRAEKEASQKTAQAQSRGPGLGAVAATIAALYIGFGPNTGVSTAADLEMPYVAPTVNTQSSEETITLAKRLREAGAKMYGAFWCSHCYDQKQEFGQQAMSDFPYVECFPEGWKKGVKIADACEAAMVKAFPTWVIGTQVTEGQLEIAQLEQLLDAATAPAAPAESPVAAAAASQ
eukprot:GHRR01003686.1.p1 GENE.GHRR01003686.1~~GHRR01003686.1.p1  ORF type:complete len:210 (+),score=63.97 GHRR01003686.1:469-1098(+)